MKTFLIFPMNLETCRESNDFLFVIVKTILENRGISGNVRVQQLLRGIKVQKKPESWNRLHSVEKSNGWFKTKKAYDMDLIGSLIGYFLRTKARQFCSAIQPKKIPQPNFEDVEELMAICGITIKPVVLEITAVDRTIKRFKNFPRITDAQFATIKSDENVLCSKSVTMHRIKKEFEELAWSCLDSGHFSMQESSSHELSFDAAGMNILKMVSYGQVD